MVLVLKTWQQRSKLPVKPIDDGGLCASNELMQKSTAAAGLLWLAEGRIPESITSENKMILLGV